MAYEQVLNFIMIRQPPSWPEFLEDCPDGGTIPDCEIRIDPDYWGVPPPVETYGDLEAVYCPMESLTAKCGAEVSVWMKPGCPPDTPDVVCDTDQNPVDIDPDSSETIYILDGYPPYEWEIVGGHGYSLEWESTGDVGGRPDERLNSWNTLYSSADSCGTAQVKITDNCLTEVICQFDSTASAQLNWDSVSSGSTIIQGQSGVTIAVINGIGPYTWSLEGQDFNLGATVTSGRFNTLNAGWCACGTADITVTDACGSTAQGGVRCTDCGEWELFDSCIQGHDFSYHWPDFYTDDGKYKIEYSDRCSSAYPYNWTCCNFSESYGYTFPLQQCNWCWARNPSRGQHSKTEVFIWVPGQDYEVEYDYVVSEETIDRNESGVVIAVKGGQSPYTWTCETTNFTITHAETSGTTNTLSANAVACGPCSIKVADSCGSSCTGYVRCTAGSWVQIEYVGDLQHACGSEFLNPGTGTSTGSFDKIIGKYKVTEQTGYTDCHTQYPSCQYRPQCVNPPYETYGDAALPYHYPCICDINIWNTPGGTWAECVQSLSIWPCCKKPGSSGSAAWLHSRYWGRSKYEWKC